MWQPLDPEEKARRKRQEEEAEARKQKEYFDREKKKREATPRQTRIYQNPDAVVIDLHSIKCDLTEKELWATLDLDWTSSGISPVRVQFRAGTKVVLDIPNPVFKTGALPEPVYL